MSVANNRDAAYWIEHLGLLRHPEGGWFRETYRSAETIPLGGLPERFDEERSISTAICFLLEQGDISALHRIKSDEVWHFYAGAPLKVHMISPGGERSMFLLGRDVAEGERLQAVVPAGCWFGAELAAGGDYALVGCTVAPGFDFNDFEMADRNECMTMFPDHAEFVLRLTRG
jgi:predicted cupin superfamily sugar epimerase